VKRYFISYIAVAFCNKPFIKRFIKKTILINEILIRICKEIINCRKYYLC
jgi:hypothetical protein